MYRLAKLGFSQSYTYFTWRNTEAGAHRLLHGARRDSATTSGRTSGRTRRTSCTSTCKFGGRPAFMCARGARGDARRELRHLRPCVRAARAHAARGRQRGVPRLGEVRDRALGSRPPTVSLRIFLARLNTIRREQPGAAIATTRSRSAASTTTSSSATRSTRADCANVILVVVNLDPHHAAERLHRLPLDEWRIDAARPYQAHELLSDARYRLAGAARLRDARTGRMSRLRVPHSSARHAARPSETSTTSLSSHGRSEPHRRTAHSWATDASRRSALVQGRRHLSAARALVLRSNDDGVGDFPGLTSKLDYIERLGVSAIWLLPFYPSPMRDDGYDIADYLGINPVYGTQRRLRSVRARSARRGLKIITELVVNHTSDQHPWFQARAQAPRGSRGTRLLRLERHRQALPRDAHHLHGHGAVELDLGPRRRAVLLASLLLASAGPEPQQPGGRERRHPRDAALARPRRRRLAPRRDSVPVRARRHEQRKPARNARGREAHSRRAIDAKYRNRMLLAEANQWPEDVREYFGDGDECHMAYHFPLMPRMYMAIAQEDRYPIVEILQQTPDIPPTCQWAIFLRNHDELTLEMVTDRERDYMYQMYAAHPRARVNVGIRRRLGAAHGERPREDPAHEQPAVLDAGLADRLLRRRARHGRQHLPGRSQRRAHADAMEPRSQWRLLARRSAEPLPAADHGPRSTASPR